MRAYVVDSLVQKMENDDRVGLDQDSFREELAKLKKKDAELMPRLSNTSPGPNRGL